MKYRSLTEEIKLLELGLPPQEDDGFIGGNLDPKEASLILIPVPWEATVSFGEGTSKAPDNIRLASHQLDVENYHYLIFLSASSLYFFSLSFLSETQTS